MRFFIIAAAQTSDGGMGYQGALPWSLKEDMKHFKTITTRTNQPNMQNVVIMGKRTFESLQRKPLPNRFNIVLTSTEIPHVHTAKSLDDALRICPDNSQDVFVIGGAGVYAEALKHDMCQGVYLTKVEQTQPCDVFFPLQLLDDIFEEQHRQNGTGMIFSTYYRKVIYVLA